MVIPYYCEDYPEDPSLIGIENGSEKNADESLTDGETADFSHGTEQRYTRAVNGNVFPESKGG